ncbi:hypothetical protein BJV82DRAFT_616461 [Fennellomyces sp. T-0311]|nr:hypothetical protein BJV82DRAFT_616461 [Fennellomyces sp. T-0311]
MREKKAYKKRIDRRIRLFSPFPNFAIMNNKTLVERLQELLKRPTCPDGLVITMIDPKDGKPKTDLYCYFCGSTKHKSSDCPSYASDVRDLILSDKTFRETIGSTTRASILYSNSLELEQQKAAKSQKR